MKFLNRSINNFNKDSRDILGAWKAGKHKRFFFRARLILMKEAIYGLMVRTHCCGNDFLIDSLIFGGDFVSFRLNQLVSSNCYRNRVVNPDFDSSSLRSIRFACESRKFSAWKPWKPIDLSNCGLNVAPIERMSTWLAPKARIMNLKHTPANQLNLRRVH